MIHPVILSGGSGTRLWPMSRTLHPKQLLSLLGRDSLLQQTVRRVTDRQDFASPLLVANEEHRFIIAEQLREIAAVPRGLLLEPSLERDADLLGAPLPRGPLEPFPTGRGFHVERGVARLVQVANPAG